MFVYPVITDWALNGRNLGIHDFAQLFDLESMENAFPIRMHMPSLESINDVEMILFADFHMNSMRFRSGELGEEI